MKLDHNVHTRLRNSTPRLSLEFDKMYYIPLLQSLQLLLSQSAIFQEVCHFEDPKNTFITSTLTLLGCYLVISVMMATVLPINPISKDSSALQIRMYYDDVEVTNPLGSKTKTHK